MNCFHCGDQVLGRAISKDEKDFCCSGCLTVYEILHANGLEQFYEMNAQSGVKPSSRKDTKYAALDVPEIFEDFISFQNNKQYIVTFSLPAIHCSSCVYLLENLHQLHERIIAGETNFTNRTLTVTIEKGQPLSEIASLLDSIGYQPELRQKSKQKSSYDKRLLAQLGVAGFAFGNVMLWSIPEYTGIDDMFDSFRNFSAYLALIVAIPVLLFSASGYLKSAYTAVKTKQLNLDIPIAIGIIVLFVESSSSVILQQGTSYMDSFTGFVFFLLVGKWFQSKTYQNMSFDNDPKSYFPLGVHRIHPHTEIEEIIQIESIEEEDVLRIFNEEVIPCDAHLQSEKAVIDTSFITGEAALATLKKGDKIYAGSKLIGSSVEVKVHKTTDRSQFASIWNKSKKKEKSLIDNRENKLAKYFLIIVGTVALAATIFWSIVDSSRTVSVVTAILVVACPCALAISPSFVYGNAMRKLGKNGMFFRNSDEIKKITKINHLVFDKTGTLTKDRIDGVNYEGKLLSEEQKAAVFAVTRQSTHPYSKSIAQFFTGKTTAIPHLEELKEIPGKGVEGTTENNDVIRVGNAVFTNATRINEESGSHLSINGEYIGFFSFKSKLRPGILEEIATLQKNYTTTLLSGDKEADKVLFESLENPMVMHFECTPTDKKNFLDKYKEKGDVVAFIGDGLNDTEALNHAELGISVAEDDFRFTPECDAIIKSEKLSHLHRFFKFGFHTRKALLICMVFSLLYNTFGVTFAFMGYVTPLFAAILMPTSSVTIVLLSTFLIQGKRI